MSIESYRALSKAAEKIGHNNYQTQLAAHLQAGGKETSFRFVVSETHQRVVDAMVDERLTDLDAGRLLFWDFEVLKEMWGF